MNYKYIEELIDNDRLTEDDKIWFIEEKLWDEGHSQEEAAELAIRMYEEARAEEREPVCKHCAGSGCMTCYMISW